MFPDVSHKKGVLKKFAEFTGKHACPCFFFKKVASLKQSSLEYSPTFEWKWESSLCPLLRKKCPYSELFWSTFSRIRTEYGEICISSYLVWMRENADQNNFKYWRFSCSVLNASPNLPNNMIVSVICTSFFLTVLVKHQINFFHQPFHVRKNCIMNWPCLTVWWLNWFVWFLFFLTWNMYFKYRFCCWPVSKDLTTKILNSWYFSWKLIAKQSTRLTVCSIFTRGIA